MSAESTPAGLGMTSDSPTIALRELGWSHERAATFSRHAALGRVPGRIVSSSSVLMAMTALGAREVILQRRRRQETKDGPLAPTIGDWLALETLSDAPGKAALREILPRQGTFARAREGDAQPQVLAANLDLAFLVSGLDHDLNPRRIERYFLLALGGGVTPVIVLNKADVALDMARAVSEVHRVAPGTRVIVSSALTGEGVDEMRGHLGTGQTACLLGSSGVGKSSLLNAMLGEQRQVVRSLREDDSRGRHTTRHRELFQLADGGLIIDTPGLRSVGVLGDEAVLETSFSDVRTLARRCRFTDCGHQTEPGCAVRAAVEAGALPAARLASHRKLEAELRSVALRADVRSRRADERRMGRLYRHHGKFVARQKRGEE
jgi:ribosome biogenesis GTPase